MVGILVVLLYYYNATSFKVHVPTYLFIYLLYLFIYLLYLLIYLLYLLMYLSFLIRLTYNLYLILVPYVQI